MPVNKIDGKDQENISMKKMDFQKMVSFMSWKKRKCKGDKSLSYEICHSICI